MLVSAKEMLEKAKAGHYAVGQFNINNLEWTKAILQTAQENNSPVILGVSEGAGKYMAGYKTIVGMVNGMLEEMNITVPVALHLDHGSYEACYKCIEAGFSSVMFDGSHYPIEENVAKTKELVKVCNEKGMSLEAEVGSIGGEEDGVIGMGECADPQECKAIADLGVSMLAAGNSVYFSPHPGAKNVSLKLITTIEDIAFRCSGIHNLIVTVSEPTFAATEQMMAHPKISVLAITGGPGIVAMGMKSGKKVIGAGAGNPPCIVDETADIVKAAEDIINGASFDYNLPCIAEKSLIVVASVADYLIQQMQSFGALLLNYEQTEKLRAICLPDGSANKKLVGKSPSALLEAAGLPLPAKAPRLLIAVVDANDSWVTCEQLMPMLPIVKVNDFDSALTLALKVEDGLHHTAIMHSQNVSRLNLAARVMQTSIFVKNGPSWAGIGVGGEGFTTFTIATPTGEGTTSARTFARSRRCVLTSGF